MINKLFILVFNKFFRKKSRNKIDLILNTNYMDIDWTNPKNKISEHFTVGEVLFLPKWKVYHIPSEIEKKNILKAAEKMELIRSYLNCPLNVHIWLRPILNNESSPYHREDYNAFIKGAKASAHKIGLAVDFSPKSLTCLEAKQLLLVKLEEFNIRLEDNGDEANWLHIDLNPPINNRFFKP